MIYRFKDLNDIALYFADRAIAFRNQAEDCTKATSREIRIAEANILEQVVLILSNTVLGDEE